MRELISGGACYSNGEAAEALHHRGHGGHRGQIFWFDDNSATASTGLILRVLGVLCGNYFDRSVFWTVCTSLSPRPDRLTSSTASRPSSRASLRVYAIACADSSAGRIPSSFARSWNAPSASSSLTCAYSVLPSARSHACSGPTAA